jgi:hypothetical protein
MDIERAAVNTFLVPARSLETHYLLVFTLCGDISVVKKCICTNEASTTGPLLLEIEEKASPVATDAEVELRPGDWSLVVYGQNSSTNLNTSLTVREVHSEQIRVNP